MPPDVVGISEAFGDNHAGHEKVTQALAHDRSDNYSSAQRPECRVFNFEKISRKPDFGPRRTASRSIKPSQDAEAKARSTSPMTLVDTLDVVGGVVVVL